MKSEDIRRLFIEYFRERGHEAVPSSGLVPEADPTLLFTNAGMVQFKKVFLGEEVRDYRRAVTCQKCMRAGGKHNDLENVGKTARHHTFFEMLGNFSFGDYFKEGAVEFAWDLLTRVFKLPPEKLYATVYTEDDEAVRIWKDKAGLPDDRIVRLGPEHNFWSMGDVGPCGPCSEIVIDQGPEVGCGRPTCGVGCDCDRYLELWNLVFMQYNREPSGELTPLPRPSIDTGMGLERLASVMQGKKSNYDSDLFRPIIDHIVMMSGVEYGASHEKDVSIKAIADHARAVSFLITDGVLPGNVGRGYVLRRIIRRAVRHGRFLGLKEPFLHRVAEVVIELMGGVYPELGKASGLVTRGTLGEEERFFETLDRGLTLLDEEVKGLKERKEARIPGEVAFRLYDTYGFPVDLTADIVSGAGLTVDFEGFERFMEEQREKARAAWKGVAVKETLALYTTLASSGLRSEFTGYHMDASRSRVLCIIKEGHVVEEAHDGDTVEIITEETPFYGESGGQVGDTGIILGKDLKVKVLDTKRPLPELIVHHSKVEKGRVTTDDTVELIPDIARRAHIRRNHTGTHLLHAALRSILGPHIRQAGSLVSPESFRFDFNHFAALTDEERKRVEDEVNAMVLRNIEVVTEIMPYARAQELGVIAFFGEKYGEVVRAVQIPGVSAELCGGTHVSRTGDIGLFKITGESSVAAGVRRIEAVTGEHALLEFREALGVMSEAGDILKVPHGKIPEKIVKLLERQKELEEEIEKLKGKLKADVSRKLAAEVRTVGDIKLIASKVEVLDPKELREMADSLRARLGSGIVVLGGALDGKALLLAAVTRDLTGRFSAGEIIKRLAPLVGGKGGGKADLAQAGGAEVGRLDEAIEKAYETVKEMSVEKV